MILRRAAIISLVQSQENHQTSNVFGFTNTAAYLAFINKSINHKRKHVSIFRCRIPASHRRVSVFVFCTITNFGFMFSLGMFETSESDTYKLFQNIQPFLRTFITDIVCKRVTNSSAMSQNTTWHTNTSVF